MLYIILSLSILRCAWVYSLHSREKFTHENHYTTVLHCPQSSVITSLLEQAPDWLTRCEYTPKFRFLNLRESHVKKRSIRAASFTRIAPQDCLSRLCIDLTCKSFARIASFASGVNAPLAPQNYMKSLINAWYYGNAPKAERNSAAHLKRAAQTVYPLGSKFKTAAQRKFTRADVFTH